MSLALLDTGTQIANPGFNGLVSRSLLFCCIGISLDSNPHSEKLQQSLSNAMNPPNFGDLNSGFSNSGEDNPYVSFGTPSVSRSSGKGHPKPRLVKLRKQSNSQNLKSNAEVWTDPGVNPFRLVAGQAEPHAPVSSEFGFAKGGSDEFVFGASKSTVGGNLNSGKLSMDNGVVEEMKNLRIGSGSEFLNPNLNVHYKSGFVFGSEHIKSSFIDENMKKLSIDDGEKVVDGRSKLPSNNESKFEFGSGDNVGIFTAKSAESVLPNEMKKLNIEDTRDFAGDSSIFGANDMKKFRFRSSEKGGDILAESAKNARPDQIKNLNIKGSVDTNNIDNRSTKKDSFAFGSMKSTGDYMSEEGENTLLNEMRRKLKIGSASGESSGQTDMGYSSCHIFLKEVQTGKKGDNEFHDFGDAAPAEFILKGEANDATGSQVPLDQPKVDTQPSAVAGLASTFSSRGPICGNCFGVPHTDEPEKSDAFNFTSKQGSVALPFVEFKTPDLKAGLFSASNQKMEFNAKFKDSKVKKKKGKWKQRPKVYLLPGKNFVSSGSGSQYIPDASESYSPMDVSPYQETLSDAQLSRETSVASEESFTIDNHYTSNNSQPTVLNDTIDELVVAAQKMDMNEGDIKCEEKEEEASEHCFDKGSCAENPPEESISGAETESFKSANEEIDFIDDTVVTSTDHEASSSPNIEGQDSEISTQFVSCANLEDVVGSSSKFSASSSSQESPKNHHRKNRTKVGHNSSQNAKVPYPSSILQFTEFSGASLPLSPTLGMKVGPSISLPVVGDNSELLRGQQIKQEPDLISSASVAAQEACEKWRLRGNQAYKNGDLSKAEDCYTQGLNCVSKGETSRSCLRALMLCYSNLAATRMSLGRMREALSDCKAAATIDPNFLRGQVRTANCYLALGEVEDASLYFKKCLQLGTDVCVDRKIVVEASEGLQKAQKVSECMQRSAELLQSRTANEAGSASELISVALILSPYSEKLLEMKAELHFMLQKYGEVIQLCEQTFDSAKKNSPPIHAVHQLANLDNSEIAKDFSFRLWRLRLIFKSYFYLGRLEEALGVLEKEELDPVTKTNMCNDGGKVQESLLPLAATIRELLCHKAAGNEAFQAGRHAEAIERYTAALSRSIDSRPFAAICFCNRAAAYKALGQITDAIADCSLAIALDGNYVKAISRRATLYEMIRDYGQAASDLQRQIAVLTVQVEEKASQFGPSDRTADFANDIRQARLHLSTIEEEARKEIPLDMYLILGIEHSASSSEVKKAYRKAALRHHPDKAGQSLARSDNGDDGLWKVMGDEVHKDADRLFKMIGEAYAVLSDPTKRSQYDVEEEMRNSQKKRGASSAYVPHADAQRYPFERSDNTRRREVWRTYGW